MAGVHQLCREINAKCPYCHRSIDVSDLGAELFRRILKRLGRGERVEAEGFGTFRAPVTPGRKVAGLKGDIGLTRDRRIIRFRASVHAKHAVNVLLEAVAGKKGKKNT